MRHWLKNAREAKKLTQESVAESAGISRSYYTLIESGVKTPSVEVAKSIAGTLDIEWTLFFEDECSLEEHIQTSVSVTNSRNAESA